MTEHLRLIARQLAHLQRMREGVAMLPKLGAAKYQGDYRVWLQFADGVEGEVDLENELWGEVFEPLKAKNVFANFSLDKELETIVWSNGAGFAPEFLYQQRPVLTIA